MGGEVDQRSDIFSLGAVVVRTLTGRRPFPGKTFQELVTAMMSRPFHLPGKEPEVRRLDAILQRCLAIQKENRFASVAEMRSVLIPAIRRTIPPRNDSVEDANPDSRVTRKYDI
jgi:eukaryotic-like serine/threonine-protein kinase